MKNHRVADRDRGFTLIELMIAIAMVAVLMAIAAPSFTSFQRNAELTSTANTLFSALTGARSEAIKQGKYALVVPADGSNWTSGWVVFVDEDRDQAKSSADVTIVTADATPSTLAIAGTGSAAGSTPYVMYDASGYARLKAGAGFSTSTIEISRNDVTGTELLAQTRRIQITPTGHMRVCTPKTSSDTQCSNS